MSTVFNVRNFGAKGDGRHDDTVAINNAIKALSNNGGGVLYFPAGDYMTKRKHQIKDLSCRIKGDGVGLTAIEWETNDGGIEFDGGSFRDNNVNSLHVTDIALVTRRKLGGTALSMKWDVGNLSAVQHFKLENIQIKGSTLYADTKNVTAWTTGIFAEGAYNSVIHNVHILGSSGLSVSEANRSKGIVLRSAPGHKTRATGYTVSDFYCNFLGRGIVLENIEGFYMSRFELALNQMGIRVHNVYVFTISEGHVDYRSGGIICSKSSALRINGCAIKHAAGTAGNAIEFNNCKDNVVGNSSFYGPGDTSKINANAIAIAEYTDEASEMTIIEHCTFQHFPQVGVWLRGGTRKNIVANNIFKNMVHSIFDQGTDNVTSPNVG